MRINTTLVVAIIASGLLGGCGGGGSNSNSITPVPSIAVPVANAAPVVNAGPAQNVTIGAFVVLDGTASTDANNDLLTYAWTLTSKPAGSAATFTLVGAASGAPSFTADVAGIYVATLAVSDGYVKSASATVTITASVANPVHVANSAPVAHAGAAQSVATGSLVTLNGATSTDKNNDKLTFVWGLSSKPTGSAATLAGATSAAPSFTADVAGSYIATLTVSDGLVNSASATVTITAFIANAAPVANAGAAQTVATGDLVTLNGAASTDANNDSLTFAWRFTSIPIRSTATLAGATTEAPSFTPDVAGSYVAILSVNDGLVNSIGATVTIAVYVAPVANAGTAQTVSVASLVYVNGAASTDANNDKLTYAWTLASKPSGSTAALTSAITPVANFATSFTADLVGTYMISLVVNNGKINSAATTVTIIAVPDLIAGATWTYTPSTWESVTDATVPNGGVVYKAATVPISQYVTASTTINVTTAASVRFYYKVDSEANYDKLTFTVDGVEPPGGHWSGLVPWNLATFPISTGTHTLTWTYSKDALGNTGLDTAWISQVSFGGTPAVIPSPFCTLDVQTTAGKMTETFSKVTRTDPTEDFRRYPVPVPQPYVKLVTTVISGSPFFCRSNIIIVQGGRQLGSYFTADRYGVDAGYTTCETLLAGVSNIIYLKLNDPAISWFNPSLPFSITEESFSMGCSLY